MTLSGMEEGMGAESALSGNGPHRDREGLGFLQDHFLLPANQDRAKDLASPGLVAQLVGASSCIPKSCRFDSSSGQLPGFRIPFLVGVQAGIC